MKKVILEQALAELSDAIEYIAYIERQEVLWILAIAHSHRKPEYWIKRMSKK